MRFYNFLAITLFLFGGLIIFANFANLAFAQTNHIIINEIQIAGQTAKDEFVELYNPTDQDINLENWALKKKTKSGAESNLVSSSKFLGTIPAYGYFLITHQSGYEGATSADITFSGKDYSIANDSTVILYNAEEQIIDKVGFGLAVDKEGDVVLNPDTGWSIERKNHQDTDNNFNDFLHQETPTPQNSQAQDPPEPPEEPSDKINIIINEIAWMGTLEDVYDEWIELFNNSSSTVMFENWTLKITEKIIDLSGEILPGEYLVIDAGSLNNSGENLELFDNNQNLIDSLDASSGWPGGNNSTKQTLEKSGDAWQTSLEPNGTPGAVNSHGADEPEPDPQPLPITPTSGGGGSASPPENKAPIANAGSDQTIQINQEIVFDAGESSDPDNDELSFFWNFGNGETSQEEKISYAYKFPGEYLVTLTVSDGEFESTDTLTIFVFSAGLIISEFDPENNWIEIYNKSQEIINLENYALNSFVFPKGSLINPEQYLVIILNNLENSLRLIYPNQQVVQQIDFQEIKKNSSVNRISDQEYFWSSIKTPGTSNYIKNIKNQNFETQIILPKKSENKQAKINYINLTEIKQPELKQEINSPVHAKITYKTSWLSDAMGKFILILSIAVSFGLLSGYLLLKFKNSVKIF